MRKESGNGPIFLTLLAIILFTINCIELKKMTKNWPVGREPWSSGYGRRLMSKGHGFESWRRILDGHDIFHVDLLYKLYCLFEKTKNK